MATKASSKNKKNRLLDLWPGKFTWTHALVALSLMLNIALLVFLILLMKYDPFQDVYVRKGAEILCSEEYRNRQSADMKASLAYRCAEGKAHDFYLKGYNEYRVSEGLKPIEH